MRFQRFIISISLFSLSIVTSSSQQNIDFKTLISKSIDYHNKACISCDFKMVIKEKKVVNSQSIQGKLKLNGQKFFFQTEDMQVWFNGKTQWSFSKTNNEVAITSPTNEEIASLNPITILVLLRDKSQLAKSARTGLKGSGIRVKPVKGSFNASSVDLDIDSNSGKIFQVWMTDQRGTETKLMLTNHQKMECKASTFEFSKKMAPNAFINDLR